MKCVSLLLLAGGWISMECWASVSRDPPATVLLSLMEKTIQKLDSDRQLFQNRHLSERELAMLTHRELARFESGAIDALSPLAGGVAGAERVLQNDVIARDLKGWFDQYRSGKMTLQVLIRKMVHEHATATAFVEDPDLGYSAFSGFEAK